MEDRGLRNNTLVIFLSDHGELLGEHGGFFGHQLPMTPECVYVLMVFSHPSLPSGESRKHLLQQTDLYPTITNLLTDRDVDLDGDLLTGPIGKNRPACSWTIVQPPRKYTEQYLIQRMMRREFGRETAGTFLLKTRENHNFVL